MLSIRVLILSITVLGTVADELPPYIHACSQNDPNLNECVKRNANLALETLKNGDENFDLPKLDGIPLFETITIKPLTELPFSLEMKNCRVYGMDDIRVKTAKVDLEQKKFDLLFTSPQIIWQCEYLAQATRKFGKLITKSGNYNVTYNNGEYLYKIQNFFKGINGEEYMYVWKQEFDFQTVEIIHDLENIESGSFLNGFWEQTKPHFVTQDVKYAWTYIIRSYLDVFFDEYPYTTLFTP